MTALIANHSDLEIVEHVAKLVMCMNQVCDA